MIERIFIPTVKRVDNQITYESLPKELQEKVTMVVQKWERPQYHYDCDYLVLPDKVNLDDYLCLAKTRKIIYQEGCNMKYAVLDDDLVFKRRNQKRFGKPSNMEKSSRICTQEDIAEMFKLYGGWLDENNVTFCGGCRFSMIPQTKEYLDNKPIFSQLFIDGSNIYHLLDELPLTKVRFDEDVLFILSLFTRGLGSRESQTFGFENMSLKSTSTLWDEKTQDDVAWDHHVIHVHFPEFYQVLFDENGERVKGGFRNYGKTKVSWSKAYKSSQQGKLA